MDLNGISDTDKGEHLLLNFQNHCLLCLQHEDPVVLRQNVNENPRGLLDFQLIISYLTGTVNSFAGRKDNEGESAQREYYPVAKNLPPLCKLCYDILAELHLFHVELMELQRKIQNQTEAARRIVTGTMRKRGGMRAEFFRRLKIAGIPKGDIQAMEYFIGNFHDLIVEADQNTVLPHLIPVTSQCPSTMQPYHVEFVEQLDSNANGALSSAIGRISVPIQVNAFSALGAQIAHPEKIDGVLNEEVDLTTSSSSHNHVLFADEQNPDVIYEYEGDGEVEEHQGKKLEEDDDDVVILEDDEEGKPGKPTAVVIDVLDEDNYENDRSNELEEEYESDEEMDLEYWKNALSSSLIMEEVEEGGDEEQRLEEDIEVIPVNFVNVQEEQRRSPSVDEVMPQPIALSTVTSQSSYNCSSPSSELPSQLKKPLLSFQRVRQKLPATSIISSRIRYQCKHCDKSYKALQRLRYHEQEHLPGGRPKPFLCGLCDKRFSNKMLLEQHERVHTGERPCVCDICGDRFRQNSTLYRHKMAHKRQQQRLATRIGTPPPSAFFSENIE